MVRAFIMVKAGTGHAEALLDRVRDIDLVPEAHIVAGDYDIIVEAQADEVSDVINAVATRIRTFDDVSDTKTYICLE